MCHGANKLESWQLIVWRYVNKSLCPFLLHPLSALGIWVLNRDCPIPSSLQVTSSHCSWRSKVCVFLCPLNRQPSVSITERANRHEVELKFNNMRTQWRTLIFCISQTFLAWPFIDFIVMAWLNSSRLCCFSDVFIKLYHFLKLSGFKWKWYVENSTVLTKTFSVDEND